MTLAEAMEDVNAEYRGILATPLTQYQDEESNREFVLDNLDMLDAYLDERYEPVSEEGQIKRVRRLLRQPWAVTRTIIENHMMSDEARIAEALAPYRVRESIISMTMGARGAWKTNTTWGLVERIHNDTGVACYSTGDVDKIPPFANHVDKDEDVPRRSLQVKEELSVEEGARGSSGLEGRVRVGKMQTLRHKETHFAGISQLAKFADNIWVESADILFMKPLALMQGDLDRGVIRRFFETWSELMPRQPWETFVYSRFSPPRRFTMPIPRFFNKNLSHTHDLIPTMGAAVQKAVELRRGHKSPGWISTYMASRGWVGSAGWWRSVIKRANGGKDPEGE